MRWLNDVSTELRNMGKKTNGETEQEIERPGGVF